MFRLGIRSDMSIVKAGIIQAVDASKLESNEANKGAADMNGVEEDEVIGDAVKRSVPEVPEAGKVKKLISYMVHPLT